MERIMQSMNQEMPNQKRIFELNKDHSVVQKVLELAGKEDAKADLEEYTSILYNQALLMEGSPIQDPASFAQKVTKLLESSLA